MAVNYSLSFVPAAKFSANRRAECCRAASSNRPMLLKPTPELIRTLVIYGAQCNTRIAGNKRIFSICQTFNPFSDSSNSQEKP